MVATNMIPLISKNRKRTQPGNVFVESALIFVVAATFGIGALDVGLMMFTHHTVLNRVRTAGRWSAVNPFDATQITNMVLYGKPTAGQAGTELFGMSASNVTVVHDTTDGLYADRVIITVSGYSYSLFSGSIANATNSSIPSVRRTGLTTTLAVPHEYVP
jgi:hypothetical protein